MQEHDRPLTQEEVAKLEREMPRSDRTADKLGLPTHYGSIEAAEEKRFPWLRDRRRGRRRRA